MHIRLSGEPLCTIAESRLTDVYQLLGRHSFTFHLDKMQGILDIVNPLQGCRVVLESKMTGIVDRLLQPIQSILTQAGLEVTIVQSEEMRKQVVNEPNMWRQGIWITVMPDEGMELSARYFFHHRKQGKQLSQLLIMNMMKYSEIPIRGASLNWKDRSNYVMRLSSQSWTSVVLTYGGFVRLSAEQLSQLGEGIMRAAASFFTYLPILDMREKLRNMEQEQAEEVAAEPEPVRTFMAGEQLQSGGSVLEEDAGEGRLPVHDEPLPDEPSIDWPEGKPEEGGDKIRSACTEETPEIVPNVEPEAQVGHDSDEEPDFEPAFEAGLEEEQAPEDEIECMLHAEAVFEEVVPETSENIVRDEKQEKSEAEDDKEENVNPVGQAVSNGQVDGNRQDERKRQAPTYSTYTWLTANMAKPEAQAGRQLGEYSSLLMCMNQKSLARNQGRKEKARTIDLMTMQRERVKRVRTPSDKS